MRTVPTAILLGSLLLVSSACSATPKDQVDPAAVEPSISESAGTTTAAPEVKLTAQEKFAKEVMVSKPLDLSAVAIPADLKANIPDGGKGAITVMEKFIQEANSIPEFQKGSHINTAADYPLLERLRPYLTPEMFENTKKQYLEPGGTAVFHNYTNDGSGFNTGGVLGKVHPDDNGSVWQWGNEKATIEYAAGNGLQGAIIKLPVRIAFNTSDKGVVSIYANRTYQIIYTEDGRWLIASVDWSAADVRSSQDSTMLLEARSPIDNPA